jgi:glycerol uptake facilitator-like aquaporin
MMRKLFAETLGTALLLAIVVGSGIMGAALSGGNDAIALLGNTLATGAGLVVLILVFADVSGAHFNPAVTAVFALRGEIAPAAAAAYVAAQVFGAIIGVLIAHAMFDLDLFEASVKARAGGGQALGEAVATFGLVLTILGCVRYRPDATPFAVGLFITAGYWFPSSTSFANPAAAFGRMFSDSFAGIAPQSAPPFMLAQLAGDAVGVLLHACLGKAAASPIPSSSSQV